MLEKLIFSKKLKHKIIRHLIYWVLIYLYIFLATGFIPDLIFSFLKRNLIHLIISVSFIYLLIYFIFPRYFLKKKYIKFILSYITIILIHEELIRLCYYTKVEPLFFTSSFPKNIISIFSDIENISIINLLFTSISRFVMISAPALIIKIFKHWNNTTLKNKELSRRNLENRMQLLRNQIHPHFLFNTLNNLYSLAIEKSDKVPEIIIKISDILRYMLKEHNKKIVTLQEELEIIYTYIELEKLRYGKEFNIEINNQVDDVYHSIIQGPPLVLFTFVENAFKHGPGKSTHQSWIKIDIKYQSGIFTFMVENSKEQDNIQSKNNNNGLGLKNVKATQELFFPDRHSLEIIDKLDVFKAILKINYKSDGYQMFNR